MELNRYVGAQIKKFREARNMTQDDLAEKLLTTRQTVSRYENGDRKTNQDILFELANIFHVQVDDFFPDRKDKVKESNPFDTLAAHAADRDHEFTPEEIDRIKGYIDGIIDNYESKHSDDK